MVDSISNNGGVPPVQNTNRPQVRQGGEAERTRSVEAPVDKVSISEEAASLLAQDTRTLLEQRLDEALSGERDVNSLL